MSAIDFNDEAFQRIMNDTSSDDEVDGNCDIVESGHHSSCSGLMQEIERVKESEQSSISKSQKLHEQCAQLSDQISSKRRPSKADRTSLASLKEQHSHAESQALGFTTARLALEKLLNEMRGTENETAPLSAPVHEELVPPVMDQNLQYQDTAEYVTDQLTERQTSSKTGGTCQSVTATVSTPDDRWTTPSGVTDTDEGELAREQPTSSQKNVERSLLISIPLPRLLSSTSVEVISSSDDSAEQSNDDVLKLASIPAAEALPSAEILSPPDAFNNKEKKEHPRRPKKRSELNRSAQTAKKKISEDKKRRAIREKYKPALSTGSGIVNVEPSGRESAIAAIAAASAKGSAEAMEAAVANEGQIGLSVPVKGFVCSPLKALHAKPFPRDEVDRRKHLPRRIRQRGDSSTDTSIRDGQISSAGSIILSDDNTDSVTAKPPIEWGSWPEDAKQFSTNCPLSSTESKYLNLSRNPPSKETKRLGKVVIQLKELETEKEQVRKKKKAAVVTSKKKATLAVATEPDKTDPLSKYSRKRHRGPPLVMVDEHEGDVWSDEDQPRAPKLRKVAPSTARKQAQPPIDAAVATSTTTSSNLVDDNDDDRDTTEIAHETIETASDSENSADDSENNPSNALIEKQTEMLFLF